MEPAGQEAMLGTSPYSAVRVPVGIRGGKMEQQVEATRRFGSYLRSVRENRRLSLDAVEELSTAYIERVTKSHLSRIENGQAVPSFTRLYTLSRIYGVPVAMLAERFEVDLRRQHQPVDTTGKSEAQLIEAAAELRKSGRYIEALGTYEALIERHQGEPASVDLAHSVLDLRLVRANCLWHLGCHGLAKDECEELLGSPHLAADRRLLVLQNLVHCCVNLGRFSMAMMALDQVEQGAMLADAPARTKAEIAAIRGLVNVVTGAPELAVPCYLKAIELHESTQNAYEVCRCETNLGEALIYSGDTKQAEARLVGALSRAEASGYDRFKALALGHLALLRFRQGDAAGAESFALRSNTIARPTEFASLVFRNCFYLWRVAQAKGDEAGVKANERTLRVYVHRVEEHMPEVGLFRAHLAGAKP